jgi:hypothetical protein
MIAVEFTLNFNRVHGVLGEGGRAYLPSQLLPLLIGTFAFVRILWIRFEKWRNPDDIDPSLPPTVTIAAVEADPRLSGRSKTLRVGKDVLMLFSPGMKRPVRKARPTGGNKKDEDEVDGHRYVQVTGSIWRRLLVGWLPWLSLLPMFVRDSNDIDAEKRKETRREADGHAHKEESIDNRSQR